MRLSLATALLTATFFGTAAIAGPVNLVTNGTFSASSYANNSQFGTPYGGQGVTGWTGGTGYELYFFGSTATTNSAASQYDSGYNTGAEKLWADGTPNGNFVALDGDPSFQSTISQSIAGLTVGDHYSVSFSWGGAQLQSRTGPTTEQLQVSLGTSALTTQIVSNPSMGFTGWQTTTLNFTANAATEILSFLSIGTPSGAPPIALLDDVSLTDIPEPMSVAMLFVGLGGVLLLRRRATSLTA